MIPARTLLESTGVSSRVVRGLLPDVEVEATHVHAIPRWMRWALFPGVVAIALPGRIFVLADSLERRDPRLGALIVHELAHVAQWRRHGALRFLALYLGAYLRARRRGLPHREAYRSIPLEREAVAVASAALARLRPRSGTPTRDRRL